MSDPSATSEGHANQETIDQVRDLIQRLAELLPSRPGRPPHMLPDLALKMFAVQVLQYSRAVVNLATAQLNSWAFPVARAAFESAIDLSFLAFTPDSDQYDQLGALAIVGAELAVTSTHEKSEKASPLLRDDPSKQPRPEEERVKEIADRWEASRPGASNAVQSAYDKARAARGKGQKHWTTVGRDKVHAQLRQWLDDPHLSKVLDSWYDILSSRTHSGAHSPQLRWDDAHIEFLLDGDQKNPIPLATAKVALHLALRSLEHRFFLWGEEVQLGESEPDESKQGESQADDPDSEDSGPVDVGDG